MNNSSNHAQTMRLVQTALFMALIFLLGFTPIGMIPLPFIRVSILCTPVVIGTLLLGLKPGLLLGFSFGAVSAINAIVAPSALVATLMAASPVLAMVMTFAPRLLVPVVAQLVYRLVSKGETAKMRAVPFAAVAGSLTNTVLYLGLMLLFYVMLGINSEGVLAVIGGTGLIAGTSEAVVAAVIATPILAALWKVQKQ